MNRTESPTGPAAAPLPPRDARALLALAATLRQAAAAGRPQPLLRGKNLGLLRDPHHSPEGEGALFLRAAGELGARVAQIPASLHAGSPATEVEHTARMLGRLYDAIECQGLPAPLVQTMGLHAGVPVYNALAGPHHPTSALALALGGTSLPEDNRRFIVQAVLVHALS